MSTFREGVVSGIWKFRDSLGASAICDIAKRLEEGETLGSYEHIFVRTCSKNQIGVSFLYQLNGEEYNKFFDRITDMLRRRFGNDFVGWDVTPDVWDI